MKTTQPDYLDDRLALTCRIWLLLKTVTEEDDDVDTAIIRELFNDPDVTTNRVSASLTQLRRAGVIQIIGRHDESKMYMYRTTGKLYTDEPRLSPSRYGSKRNRIGGYKVTLDDDVVDAIADSIYGGPV